VIVTALASLALAGPAGPGPDLLPPVGLAPPDEDSPSALAAPRRAPERVRLVVRGLGELWHDPWIGGRYRTGGLGAGLGLVVPLGGFLAVDAEVGYARVQATDGEGAFQVLPVAILAEARWTPAQDGVLELFGGLGPALTMWSEGGQDPAYTGPLQDEPVEEGPTVLRGARPGLELRVGTRIDLGFGQPSLAPAPEQALDGVELEIFLSRRLAPTGSGFDLNAWRAGLGVALRF
jgi:hypothetical protein